MHNFNHDIVSFFCKCICHTTIDYLYLSKYDTNFFFFFYFIILLFFLWYKLSSLKICIMKNLFFFKIMIQIFIYKFCFMLNIFVKKNFNEKVELEFFLIIIPLIYLLIKAKRKLIEWKHKYSLILSTANLITNIHFYYIYLFLYQTLSKVVNCPFFFSFESLK